jgi:ABC-type glycerol-3-phosphate transport system substrate-binding protein
LSAVKIKNLFRAAAGFEAFDYAGQLFVEKERAGNVVPALSQSKGFDKYYSFPLAFSRPGFFARKQLRQKTGRPCEG